MPETVELVFEWQKKSLVAKYDDKSNIVIFQKNTGYDWFVSDGAGPFASKVHGKGVNNMETTDQIDFVNITPEDTIDSLCEALSRYLPNKYVGIIK